MIHTINEHSKVGKLQYENGAIGAVDSRQEMTNRISKLRKNRMTGSLFLVRFVQDPFGAAWPQLYHIGWPICYALALLSKL